MLVAAQACPTKPVSVVVPWPAGRPSDIAARPVAMGSQEAFRQPFVIDNRGGAGGSIGTAMVAKGAADGYTVLVTSSAPIVINPSVYKPRRSSGARSRRTRARRSTDRC